MTENLTLETAIAHLRGDDRGLRVYAAWWLGRFRVHHPEAIALLIEALADEGDRTAAGGYPLRRNAARALGKLGDGQAVAPLMEALACTDFYVREAAAQSLAMLQAPVAIAPLRRLLRNQVPDTEPAPEPPHLAQPYDALIEALGDLGAHEAIADIEPFLAHEVPRIGLAAARALYQLTGEAHYGERLVQGLSHPDLQLRRAALADLGASGYLPAAQAIAQTLAENSLKLMALRSILEQNLGEAPSRLEPVLQWMDELL
ncbi:MAG: HEAT repeat domain-containing protein [Pseudanabaenaceae cyanobacterium]